MKFEATAIDGAVVVVPEPHTDERGWFGRIFCREEFAANGLGAVVAQTNIATTNLAGTVRGLHYQLQPAAETKLIRCTRGAVFDVVVDLRSESETFGRWVGVELSADDGRAMHVPQGCAHGYQSLVDDTAVLYEVSAPYTPERERGLHHADPAVGIVWPLDPSLVSPKDQGLPELAQAELPGPEDVSP